MNLIYSTAFVTLVAAEGFDSQAGLSGVRPGSRPALYPRAEVVDGGTIYARSELVSPLCHSVNEGTTASSAWCRRGWTF